MIDLIVKDQNTEIRKFPDPKVAIHRAKWCTNIFAYNWIMYGGGSGILRLQCIDCV